MLVPVSIFLIILGGIFAFGLRSEPDLLDFDAIGWTFILVGLLGIVLHGYVLQRRREAARLSRGMPARLYENPSGMPTDPRDPRADD
jgi:hypothetical protein